MTTRSTLYFARPFHVEVRAEQLPPLGPQQVRVDVICSAISAGTELLFYRGQVPPTMSVDSTISGLNRELAYPLTYGYCVAGEVVATGRDVCPTWRGTRVFAFHPHTSAFVCETELLHPIPDGIDIEQAVMLPTMETAVNFIMDAQPMIGERVWLAGLGVVGLLTAWLLRQYPLDKLIVSDFYAKRLTLARQWQLDARHAGDAAAVLAEFDPDLILEVSSNPAALADALAHAGFGARVIIGSWYGDKIAHLQLGGAFHRNRVQVTSSQVSTLDGRFHNRWSKQRRLQVAWDKLRTVPVGDLISHRLPIAQAPDAYELLDKHPEEALQVVFTY